MLHNSKITIVYGPTASGKTAFALSLARKRRAVIINADAMQIYREIPIITAQLSDAEKEAAPHRLYGALSATEKCTVARWLQLVKPEIEACFEAGVTPILVGGTGMYISSLINGISDIPNISNEVMQEVEAMENLHEALQEVDPETAARISPSDSQRLTRAYAVWRQTGKPLSEWQKQPATPLFPEAEIEGFFLHPDREKNYAKVNQRFEKMVDNGAVEEAETMRALGLDTSYPAMKAHGVPELIAYLNKEMTMEEAITQAQRNTRHYVKRQCTWFRNQFQGKQGWQELTTYPEAP